MTKKELYDIINAKYHFVNSPTEDELNRITEDVRQLLMVDHLPSDDKFLEILEKHLRKKTRMIFSSVDMSDSTSIIQQIIAKINNKER